MVKRWKIRGLDCQPNSYSESVLKLLDIALASPLELQDFDFTTGLEILGPFLNDEDDGSRCRDRVS